MEDRPTAPSGLDLARAYLAAQAVAGVLWWIAVFVSDDVRRWTLGDWRPELLVVPDLVLFVGTSALAAARTDRRAAAVASGWTALVTAALLWEGLVDEQAGWGALLMSVALAGTVLSSVTLWFGHLPLSWFFIGPFAFREARPDHTARRHLLHSFLQLIVFWTIFLLITPLLLSRFESRLRLDVWPLRALPDWPGLIVFGLGSIAGLWSCISMALFGRGTPLPAATATELVIAGPYRFVRNPMAVAGAVQTIGIGMVLGSWLAVGSAVIGGLLWNSFIRPSEEADLLARFGDPYRRYCSEVSCWIPRRAD